MSSTPPAETYVGLDLGTSGLRAIIVSPSGDVLSSCSSSNSVCSHPHPTWSEQDPDLWLSCVRQVFNKLHATHPALLSGVRGIGVSGHMHGLVALDESHKPVIPCILWNDTRAVKEAEELGNDPSVIAGSGNPVVPGMTAPKVLWLRRHYPDKLSRVKKIMLPKDYVNLYLTGKAATEKSDFAGTCYHDVRSDGPNINLLRKTTGDLCQVDDLLPPIFHGCDVVGSLLPDVASELHLPGTVQVVAGAADNAAAACGLGMTSAGDSFVSLGTSGIFFHCTGDECVPSPENGVHAFAHAVPDSFYGMGVTLCAADSLAWLGEIIGKTPGELVASLPNTTSGPGQILFLPYLSGERTPYNEDQPKGAFLGLARNSSPADLARAVIEGVAFSIRDCMDVVMRAQKAGKRDVNVQSVFITGGGARADFWASTIAHTLRVTVHRASGGELGAAVGAARLAIVGVGGKRIDDVMTKPEIEQSFKFDNGIAALYDEAYQRYKQAYSAVRDLT